VITPSNIQRALQSPQIHGKLITQASKLGISPQQLASRVTSSMTHAATNPDAEAQFALGKGLFIPACEYAVDQLHSQPPETVTTPSTLPPLVPGSIPVKTSPPNSPQ
jgi:hypothetical protein